MAGVLAANSKDNSITYHGVQFGGADSDYKSSPPQFNVRGEFVYDDAGRAVRGVRYILTVKTIFYEDSEVEMAANTQRIKSLLKVPGKTLTIKGLGFGDIAIVNDLEWGPKPINFDWQPLGMLCWECVWTVSFFISECAVSSVTSSNTRFVAWNYSTTWQNDFEGMCTRTIAGYVQIPGVRNGDKPANVVDATRDNIAIIVPLNFRRVNNVWRESEDKTRLDFVVVDEQLPGDPLPAGITIADGTCDFDSIGPGFSKANLSISMSLKTAPGVSPGLAGFIFLNAMLAKQNTLSQRLAASGGSVIPSSISIRNRKWDGARITECAASWTLTKCLSSMLNAAGIWEPLVPGDHAMWKTSMANLWGNRGTAKLRSYASDDIIIDACSNISTLSFGSHVHQTPDPSSNGGFQLGCPNIPDDGGWLGYEKKVTLIRDDPQTLHRRAVAFVPAAVSPAPDNIPAGSTAMPIASPTFSNKAEDQHVTEQNGLPVTRVLLQFKGLRAVHKPVVPSVSSVGGNAVNLLAESPTSPRVVFDIFQCPVYYVEGWRIYQVTGPVEVLLVQGSKDSCALGTTSNKY